MSDKIFLPEYFLHILFYVLCDTLNKSSDEKLMQNFPPCTEKESLSRYLGVKHWRDLRVTVDEQKGGLTFSGTHHGRHKRLSYKEAGFTYGEFRILAILACQEAGYNWSEELDSFPPDKRQRKQQDKRQVIAKIRRKLRALFPDLDGNPINNVNNVTYTAYKTKLPDIN